MIMQRLEKVLGASVKFVLAALVFAIAMPCFGMDEERPEIKVQIGHADRISGLAFSADGRLLLTGSHDNTLRLWDAVSAREIRTFSGHAAAVTAVALSRDGGQALSGSQDGTMKLWDVPSAQVIRSFAFTTKILGKTIPASVASVAFSPDARRALSGGHEVVLWDLATGERLRTLAKDTPGRQTLAVAFSPDGRQAASAQLVSEVSGGWGLNPQYKSTFKHQLKLWDLGTGEEIRTFDGHSDVIRSLAFGPDGRQLLSGGRDKAVKLWDVASGKEIRTFTGHVNEIQSVAFSPDGRLASSGSIDGAVRLWNVADGSVASELRQDGRPAMVMAVAFSPNGKLAAAASFKSVKMWDVASGKLQSTLTGAAANISSVSFTSEGSRVLTGGYDGRLNFWSTATGRAERPPLVHASGLFSIAISRDGKRVVTGAVDHSAKVWDITTGKEIQTLTGHAGPISAVAFHPDGKQVLTGSADLTLRLWDVASGRNTATFTGHRGPVRSIAFSPDGSRALSGDFARRDLDISRSSPAGNFFTDSTLRLWDIAAGTEIRALSEQDSLTGVDAVAYSPDGRFALSSGYGTGTTAGSTIGNRPFIRLTDVASGASVRQLAGHTGKITALAFSANGKQALSGSADNMLKLWDLDTGREIRSFKGHVGQVNAVAFSPDGRLALSGSADATTRIWDLATGREILQMVRFFDDDWLAITPEGYFSASSAKAAENLNIRAGQKVYRINQFYDVFYRPDIVEASLAGKDTSQMVALTINEALRNPPPLVEKVEVPDAAAAAVVKVAYRIKSEGGGIGEVRVFHNGKLVGSDGTARQLPNSLAGKKANQITSDVLVSQMRSLSGQASQDNALKSGASAPPKPDQYDAVIDIEPVPGENEISIVAFNAQNSVQSQPVLASFNSTRAPVAPRLHILTIGIDEYKDKSARLKYAAKDARDLAARWKARAANVYGAQNIFVESISNAQASRQGVLARIDQIAARVKPTDHFMLFVASHGVLLGDQYYMVTADYDGALQASKLISANEIVDFSKRIKALSQLYILDTCHAGGMGGVVSGLYDARVSVLAKKMGLHVFASASSAEEALDGFEGNGLFTHTLLAGLNNNRQVDLNADKQVSLKELGGFAKGQTRDIARRLNHMQDPLIINFGLDNPVYKLP